MIERYDGIAGSILSVMIIFGLLVIPPSIQAQDNSNFTEEEIVAKLSEVDEVDELLDRYDSLVDRQVSQENGFNKISYKFYDSYEDAIVGSLTIWTKDKIVEKVVISKPFLLNTESVNDAIDMIWRPSVHIIPDQEWQNSTGTTAFGWLFDSIEKELLPNRVNINSKQITFSVDEDPLDQTNDGILKFTIDYKNTSDTAERNGDLQPSEKQSSTNEKTQNNIIKNGKLGLQEGDWVKYNIDIGGKFITEGIIDMMKESYVDPDSGCTFSNLMWFKTEVISVENNNPQLERSRFCNDLEQTIDDGEVNVGFIPVDVEIGDIIDKSETSSEVVGFENREYAGKTVDVIKTHSESREDYDNGYMITKTTSYYEKQSGLMLESRGQIEAVNVPFFGDINLNMDIIASDFNIPRQSNSINSNGGCLIATAAYGSEMAPQVQFLREIRDGKVMSTGSGAAFMTGFNQFYYSFSPAIADYERENPVFKEMVKIGITPMLASLSLLDYVDMNSEAEVLGYGIGMILLNIGLYLGVPITAIIKIRNQKR